MLRIEKKKIFLFTFFLLVARVLLNNQINSISNETFTSFVQYLYVRIIKRFDN